MILSCFNVNTFHLLCRRIPRACAGAPRHLGELQCLSLEAPYVTKLLHTHLKGGRTS